LDEEGGRMTQRSDLEHIIEWVPNESRVLDLGCGEGELLEALIDTKQVSGVGVDIDISNIAKALNRGLQVLQQDMELGLDNFSAKSFDAVIVAYSLQVLSQPHELLDRVADIGNEVIVSFPNFGHWRSRLALLLGGKMPKTRSLPYNWYDTPNIHFCTIVDFEALCRELKITILEKRTMGPIDVLSSLWPNLFAKSATYRVKRQ
jgi:methionine biosynthesis protein MetW